MADPVFDPYAVLQVHERAGQDVIDAAYRRQARNLHPDAPNGDEIAFQRLEAAHDLLSTAIRRADLDRERRRAGQADAPSSATPVPFVDPSPGDGWSPGWWVRWLRLERTMAHALVRAPLPLSVITAAVAGGAIGYLAAGKAALPAPASLWCLGIAGVFAWLAATAAWAIGRRRSLVGWTWAVRAYAIGLCVLIALSVIHALAQALGLILLAAFVVLIARHRFRRARTVGASR